MNLNNKINTLKALTKNTKIGEECFRKPLEKRRRSLPHSGLTQTFDVLILEEEKGELTAETFNHLVFQYVDALVSFGLRDHIKNKCLTKLLKSFQAFAIEKEFEFDYPKLSTFLLNPDADNISSDTEKSERKLDSLAKRLDDVWMEYRVNTRRAIKSVSDTEMKEIETVFEDYIQLLKGAIDNNQMADPSFDSIAELINRKVNTLNAFQRLDSEDRELVYQVFFDIAQAVDKNDSIEF